MEIINKILYKLHFKKRPRPPFSQGELLPAPIKEALNEAGLNTDSIIYAFKTDMKSAEEFGDLYVLFDEKGIYIALFEEPPLPPARKKKKAPVKVKLLSTALTRSLLHRVEFIQSLFRHKGKPTLYPINNY